MSKTLIIFCFFYRAGVDVIVTSYNFTSLQLVLTFLGKFARVPSEKVWHDFLNRLCHTYISLCKNHSAVFCCCDFPPPPAV